MPVSQSVANALTKIKRQFGDEFGVVITDSDIFGWMFEAELDIIRSTGCNDTRISIATSAFPFEVPVSVNFKRLSVNGRALQYTTKDELDLLGLSTTTAGGGKYWYREGTTVCLWPKESSSTIVEILYNKTPVLINDIPAGPINDFVVPEVYYEDIVNWCIGRAHNKNNNLQAESVQMGLYDKNLNVRRDESQSIDAPIYKGGDPMDFAEYDGSYN